MSATMTTAKTRTKFEIPSQDELLKMASDLSKAIDR